MIASTPPDERLIQILSDKRDINALLSSPKDTFNEAQRASFRELVQYFEISCPRDDATEDESTSADAGDPSTTLSDNDDEGSTSGGRVAQPPKKPSGSRSPWSRFLKMETFSLSPHIQRYLEEHGTNPLPFFDDRKVSPKQMLQYKGHDKFVAAFRFARALRSQRIEGPSRWFFILMFYNLIKLILSKAGRVGKLMTGEITDYFGALVGRVLPDARELRAELNLWCICGNKLNLLCTEFGPGCLFFLDGDGLLSVDFVSTRKFGIKSPYATKGGLAVSVSALTFSSPPNVAFSPWDLQTSSLALDANGTFGNDNYTTICINRQK